MLTSLRQIGNSRGILLPAAFLATCKMEDQVEMQLVGREIVLRPAPKAAQPRQGWFDGVDAAAERLEAEQVEALDWALLDQAAAPSASEKTEDEWQW